VNNEAIIPSQDLMQSFFKFFRLEMITYGLFKTDRSFFGPTPIQSRVLTDIDFFSYVFLLDKGYALPWCSTDTDFHTKTTMMKDEHSPGRYSNYKLFNY
jgi:hypothetical protein